MRCPGEKKNIKPTDRDSLLEGGECLTHDPGVLPPERIPILIGYEAWRIPGLVWYSSR